MSKLYHLAWLTNKCLSVFGFRLWRVKDVEHYRDENGWLCQREIARRWEIRRAL